MANKKMNKKFLPKVGSTVAVAMAMSVALSTQANATGLDDDNLPPSTPQNQTPGSQQDQTPEQVVPKEYNDAAEQKNGSTAGANQGKVEDNEKIVTQNNQAAANNADSTGGALVAPELPEVPTAPSTAPDTDEGAAPTTPTAPDGLTTPDASGIPEIPTAPTAPDASGIPEKPVAPTAPDASDIPEKPDASEIPTAPTAPDASGIPEKPTAPTAPNTDGMSVGDHNAAAGAYNDQVDDYNGKADNYNDAVEDYNDAVEDYNKDVGDYNKDAEDYNKDAEDYNEAVDDYNKDVEDYNDEADKFNDKADDYDAAVEDYNKDVEDYNKEAEDYNKDAEDYNEAAGAYNDAAKDYNDKVDDYNDKVGDYNEAVDNYNDAADKYEKEVDDYNTAVDNYNDAVEDYNTAAREYNQKVKEYNEAAYAYDQKAQEDYADELADYQKDKNLHDAAADKYEADQDKLTEDAEADAKYQQDKDAYDDACEDYLAALEAYENSLKDGGSDAEAKKAYAKAKKAYDEAHKKYQDDVKAYNDALNTYDTNSPTDEVDNAEFRKYLQEKAADYLAAMEQYNEDLEQYKSDSEAYQKYLQDKALYDAAYATYLDALYAYNTGDLAEYLEKVEQAQKENELLDEVDQYNNSVTDYNNQQTEANNALQSGVDGVVDGVGNLDETNQAVSDAFDAAKMAILNEYETRKAAVQAMAAALDTHAGKDAELGSAEYADYLDDIEAYNDAVDEFNTFVREQYNPAVTDYNTAVDDYVPPEIPSAPSSGNGVQQGSGAAVNWGNINTQTVNHVDVKYASAASKTVTKDEDGNVISSSDTVTHFTVTGVYTSEAAANGGLSTDYAVNFDNDGSGTQAPDVQLLHKSSEYAEFGSDRSGYAYHKVDSGAMDTSETYYIVNENPGYMGPSHYEIAYNSNQRSWGYYTGYRWQSVDPSSAEVFERGSQIAINPATGTISFYATVTDDKGQTHGLNVSLDANSVYANGSYYKAQFKNVFGQVSESDFLNRFVIEGENGEEITIPVVMIDDEKYYDISGQSVFLISALTCDGMTEYNGRLTPNGLDLVLNVQTMIEVHRAASPKKLAYKTYDLQKYKPTRQVTDPDEIPNPSNDLKKPTLKPVSDPTRPVAPTYNPGTFDREAPEAPTPTARLDKVKELDTLKDKKLVIEFADLEGLDEIKPLDLIDLVDPVDYLDLLGIAGDAQTIDPLGTVDPLDYLSELKTLDTVGYADYMNLRTPTVTPPVTPPTYEPVPLNDDFEVDFEIEIPDEEVPLAAAPKTGDISTLWGILSGFSAAGMALLGRKRKDEE